jgi:hypothetical protein
MILSGHQPVYLPGLILFNKIALSDRFMFVGHVQLTLKSWQVRNRIRVRDEPLFLSVPVRKAGRFGQAIDEAEIDGDLWKRKHLGSIRQGYGKRPFFAAYYPRIEELLCREWRTLGALNRAFIFLFLELLGITTPILDSRDLDIRGHKTDMLVSMCRAVGVDGYLSNQGARAYVDEAAMAAAGLCHYWQVFEHPVYDQGGPFVPDLSVLDVLFNCGPAAGALVRGCGRAERGGEVSR